MVDLTTSGRKTERRVETITLEDHHHHLRFNVHFSMVTVAQVGQFVVEKYTGW